MLTRKSHNCRNEIVLDEQPLMLKGAIFVKNGEYDSKVEILTRKDYGKMFTTHLDTVQVYKENKFISLQTGITFIFKFKSKVENYFLYKGFFDKEYSENNLFNPSEGEIGMDCIFD